jgi:hypothetical protein
MTSKHEQRGPADAGNGGVHIHPRNSSQSFARGGGVMRHVERQRREAGPGHIGGGAQQPGGDPKPPREDGDGHELGY